ncbi:hypothetical protein PUN28_009336 [Cardiocondyla obscurior]|uniref:Uncharacterized protein n=1 Tax=Cardiocondyla obscurior TaxID=286306 RepID=A0AAW2FX36_9HYME
MGNAIRYFKPKCRLYLGINKRFVKVGPVLSIPSRKKETHVAYSTVAIICIKYPFIL